MTTSPSHTFQSWSEIYQALRAKAEASRGTVTITTNDAPAATFPHTTSSDAFEILIVFDTAVHEHARGPLVDRWITESDLLAGEPDDSDERYVGNRSFWETIAIAAIELDRLHAPLPAQTSVDDAIEQLDEALEIPPQNVRNARGSPIVTAFCEPTWLAMATRQFEFFRTLRGEDATKLVFLPPIPATCNGDVLLLATYWSEQLTRVGGNASDTFHRLLFSSWRDAVRDVVRHTRQAPPHHVYPLNGPFWRALLFLAVRSDACGEAPTPWTFELPVTHRAPVRNAVPSDAGATLDFPSAPNWDDAARMQRDAFAQLRGEDLVTGRLITRVPRTTISDVRQIAAYWSNGLRKIGTHHDAGISYQHVLDRWNDAVADVDRIPLTVDPVTVYEHNVDFWEAMRTIARQVAVTAEAPTKWQLVKHTFWNLPSRLKSTAEGIWERVLAKPLLYTGLGLGGLAALLVVLRFRPAPEQMPPATKPPQITTPVPHTRGELIDNAIRGGTLILSLLEIFILGLDDWLSGATMNRAERK